MGASCQTASFGMKKTSNCCGNNRPNQMMTSRDYPDRSTIQKNRRCNQKSKSIQKYTQNTSKSEGESLPTQQPLNNDNNKKNTNFIFDDEKVKSTQTNMINKFDENTKDKIFDYIQQLEFVLNNKSQTVNKLLTNQHSQNKLPNTSIAIIDDLLYQFKPQVNTKQKEQREMKNIIKNEDTNMNKQQFAIKFKQQPSWKQHTKNVSIKMDKLLSNIPTENELKSKNIFITNEEMEQKRKHKIETICDLDIQLKNRMCFEQMKCDSKYNPNIKMEKRNKQYNNEIKYMQNEYEKELKNEKEKYEYEMIIIRNEYENIVKEIKEMIKKQINIVENRDKELNKCNVLKYERNNNNKYEYENELNEAKEKYVQEMVKIRNGYEMRMNEIEQCVVKQINIIENRNKELYDRNLLKMEQDIDVENEYKSEQIQMKKLFDNNVNMIDKEYEYEILYIHNMVKQRIENDVLVMNDYVEIIIEICEGYKQEVELIENNYMEFMFQFEEMGNELNKCKLKREENDKIYEIEYNIEVQMVKLEYDNEMDMIG
eukprot:146006_1